MVDFSTHFDVRADIRVRHDLTYTFEKYLDRNRALKRHQSS